MKNIKTLIALWIVWTFTGVPGFAADKKEVVDESITEPAKSSVSSRIIKLDEIDVDLTRLEKEGSYSLGLETQRQKVRSGKEVDIKHDRRVEYFKKSERIAFIDSAIYDDASQGHLKVFDTKGVKIFEKKLERENGVYRNFQMVRILGRHYVAAFTADVFTEPRRRLEIYDTDKNMITFSTSCNYTDSIYIPPSDDYLLLQVKEMGKSYVEIYKYDFKVIKNVINGEGLFFEAFSSDGKSYLVGKTKTINTGSAGYPRYVYNLSFFTNDLLKASAETVEFEFPKKTRYSINNRYVIFSAETAAVKTGKKIIGTPVYSIFDTATAKILAEGKLSPDVVDAYINEVAVVGGR